MVESHLFINKLYEIWHAKYFIGDFYMAKADLKEIAIYTQDKWGRGQCNEYLTMLDACFHQLAANPLKGKDYSDIRNCMS